MVRLPGSVDTTTYSKICPLLANEFQRRDARHICTHTFSHRRWSTNFDTGLRSQQPFRKRPVQRKGDRPGTGLVGLANDLPDIAGIFDRYMAASSASPLWIQTTYTRSWKPSFINEFQEHLELVPGRHTIKGGFQLSRWRTIMAQLPTRCSVARHSPTPLLDVHQVISCWASHRRRRIPVRRDRKTPSADRFFFFVMTSKSTEPYARSRHQI